MANLPLITPYCALAIALVSYTACSICRACQCSSILPGIESSTIRYQDIRKNKS